MAEKMDRTAAEKWIARARQKAMANVSRALASLVGQHVSVYFAYNRT